MRRQTPFSLLKTLAGATAGLMVAGAVAAATPAPPMAPLKLWKPRYVTLKHARLDMATLVKQASSGGTIPFWTASVTSPLDHITYTTSMVGSSPFATTPSNTKITYVPIVARVHFGGTVLDPSKVASCQTKSSSFLFWNSQIFHSGTYISNGINVSTGVVGGTQLGSAFQRANFWSSVRGTAYGVTLVESQHTPIIVDITAPAGYQLFTISKPCGGTAILGEMDINAFDTAVANIAQTYATPSQIPLVLTYNVVWFDTTPSNCCILGYHNAIPVSGGAQTYAVGAYIDSGVFSGTDDVSVWSHEISEWLDDPFVQASVGGGGNDDLTPAWGNIGQVSGCQNNLEVGDPLSGTEYSVSIGTGFIYHYQDEAFHDWFYRTPSTGSGGKYSFKGVLTTTQGVC